jgi:small ligand-binding sensory domain FIST
MRFASHLARGERVSAMIEEACAAVAATVPSPTVIFPFLRAADPNDYRRVPELIRERWPQATVFGCAAGGVIGGGHEEEDLPALGLTAADLPGELTLVHLPPDLIGEGGADLDGIRARLATGSGDILVIVDPFSMTPDAIIGALDQAAPGVVKLGALASGGPAPRSSMLFGQIAHRSGALALRLGDAVRLRPLVAQGCRPIGRPHVVTRVEDQHSVLELDGKPAIDALQALFQSLSAEDKKIFRHSLFVGLEMDKSAVEVRTDRLLVRNLLGVDPERGSIGVAADVAAYDVLHFVLRDSESAALELGGLLDAAHAEGATPAGALLFQCLGRGRHLFGRADHDPDLFRRRFATAQVGGFFANGEIAPVGGKTFLHGYTSAFAMFELADPTATKGPSPAQRGPT